MQSRYKRVNVMLDEEHHSELAERQLNVSGLIRDLLGDYLAENKITIQVSEDTRHLYDTLVANTGSSDKEIEVHLRSALAKLLEQKIGEMQQMHEKLVEQPET
jgi:ribosomal silencing factor RsfS